MTLLAFFFSINILVERISCLTVSSFFFFTVSNFIFFNGCGCFVVCVEVYVCVYVFVCSRKQCVCPLMFLVSWSYRTPFTFLASFTLHHSISKGLLSPPLLLVFKHPHKLCILKTVTSSHAHFKIPFQ